MKSVTKVCLLALAGCATSLHVAAAEPSGRLDEWTFGVETYVWGANVDTTSPNGTSSEIRFTDLAEDLEFGFMAAFGASFSPSSQRWFPDPAPISLVTTVCWHPTPSTVTWWCPHPTAENARTSKAPTRLSPRLRPKPNTRSPRFPGQSD